MAITASFIYAVAKKVMLGKTVSMSAGVSLNSLSVSSSLYAALILESYSPDQGASTSTTIKAVFASRVNNTGEHAGWGSVTNDIVLTGVDIVDTTSAITAFDAADVATPSVSTGQSIGGILIYRRMSSDSSHLPIALIDIGSPVTANGASININWDNGNNRILALT